MHFKGDGVGRYHCRRAIRHPRLDPQVQEEVETSYPMKASVLSLLLSFSCIAVSTAQQLETRKFTSAYNVSVDTPKDWVWDSEAIRDVKVEFAKMMQVLRADGKIRLLNTGPDPSEGYARIRLSILSEVQPSQEETRDVTEDELALLKEAMSKDFARLPMFKVDMESVAVTQTRIDTVYWGYRISYTRSGIKSPVRVEQYFVPFSNRAVVLTLSYELANKKKFAPIMLRVLSSLDLDDESLWPAIK